MNSQTDVVLIVWNPDVIDLASIVLRERNLAAVGIEPIDELDELKELIDSFDPSVVVLDLAPPYKKWAELSERLLLEFPHRAFAFTCADPRLAFAVAPWLALHPIFQKPWELDAFTETVFSMVTQIALEKNRCLVCVAS